MIVAFCGHSKVSDVNAVSDWLLVTCQQLIEEGAETFYFGGYGSFDSLAHQTILKLQKNHKGLTSVLIMPYLNWNVDISEYDETLYPPLEEVPPRFAISKRNEWMAEQADIIISYITHDWGGAIKTFEHARRKHKRIINYKGTQF